MKSKCCNKPLRLSRENPEPGETMYYICDGCNQPADPKDDYVDKNYPDEREVSKLKEASMQSKPQLSAEIEKLFDEEFTVAEIWGMPLPNYNGRKIIYEDEALNAVKEHNKKVKHFLATALEEQRKAINDEWLYQKANDHDARIRADERAKVLREVEELLMDETLISYASWRRSTRKYGGTQEEYERLEDILNNQNQLRAELRTKLNQLKGKNDHRTNDLRVLKPGGYLLSFGGTRTYHRMASAIEDAGFEVRDMIEWVYGCLSEDTEILTANGWKMLYSVFEGDYVFACDYKNDMKLQLEPVKQKFIYDYDEDAYHIKDTGYYNSELMETDHIVSKNHNVLVLESWVRNAGFGNDLYWEKIPAEKLYENIQKIGGKKTFRIPGLNGDIPCTIKKIPYKGKVWCVEVESGAFVARRKGKIFITGNSGFPKSLNIGKAVDKLQGNKRETVREYETHDIRNAGLMDKKGAMTVSETKGTSEWEGWGTALKPSHEPICMARKPLAEKTVAENCLKWGTGGINIDESRVEYQNEKDKKEGQYTCPLCGFKKGWALFFALEECPKCGSGASLAILQWQHYTKEIASIKKWLKGRNIPTETKDELRRRLNKIGG